MLDERAAIFREIGRALEKNYNGRFQEFLTK